MVNIFSRFNITRKHPLTGEYVLDFKEIKEIIHFVESTQCAIILGGDILNTSYKYVYASWFYEPNQDTWSKQVKNSCNCSLQQLNSLEHPEQYLYILVLQPNDAVD